jgi:hypothetical protein
MCGASAMCGVVMIGVSSITLCCSTFTFRIKRAFILGHPFRNPRLTALSNIEILGFPSDWCANRTAFMRVRTECVNDAMLGGVALGAAISVLLVGGVCCKGANGKVHKSVDMLRCPTKIILPLYCTSTRLLWKTMTHSALHKGRMPNRDAIAKSGMICPVNGLGRPGTTTSHVCVEWTCRPLGRFTVRGRVAIWRFGTCIPSCTNIDAL